MRRLFPFAWFVSASLAAAPAGAAPVPQQFDLECAGTAGLEGEPPRSPFRAVFHVDLASNRFCTDDCFVLRRIAEVTPQLITLDSTTGAGELATLTKVSTYAPETRHYRARHVSLGPTPFTWLTAAQCAVRSFTPFPANAVTREGD